MGNAIAWRALWVLVSLVWFCHSAWAKPPVKDQPVTLNFVNAEIETVARTVANLTQRRLVVDPRVKGTLTLNTERAVPASVAWDQLLSALRLQGYAVIETRGLFKLVWLC